MKKGRICMTLKSDTCFGTGESSAGIVDIETRFDERGFPYVPSKRLKGLLRDEAMGLSKLGDAVTPKIIEKLFGATGEEGSGALRIDNGELEDKDAYIAYLEKDADTREIMTPSNVQELFSATRTQTAIDKDGTAAKDTLRVTRVVNRHNVFHFPITIFEFESELWQPLVDIVKCVRHIGTSRNRGLGWVSCTLEEVSEKVDGVGNECSEAVVSGDSIVAYKVELLTDCVLDETCIPGSMLLGATAGTYLREKAGANRGNAHEQEEFSALFLEERVSYGNAYPFSARGETVPVPLCFRYEKGINDQVCNLFIKVDSGKQYEAVRSRFCVVLDDNGGTVKLLQVSPKEYFHHRRSDNPAFGNAGEDGDFYWYSAVAGNNVFSGTIIGEPELTDRIVKLLHGKEIYLGKSRSAQYGKCKISFMKYAATEPDNGKLNNKMLPLLLKSDCILRSSCGEPTVTLDAFLQELCDKAELSGDKLSICLEKTTVAASVHSGFNSRWRMPKPVAGGLARGSVITLDVSKLSKKERHSLLDSLAALTLGEHTESGYGRVGLAPVISHEVLRVQEEKDIPDAQEKTAANVSAVGEAKFLPKWSRLEEKLAKRELRQVILNSEEKFPTTYIENVYRVLRKGTSKSALTFLSNLAQGIEGLADIEQGFKHPLEKEAAAAIVKEKEKETKPYTKLYEVLKSGASSLSEAAESLRCTLKKSALPLPVRRWANISKDSAEIWKYIVAQVCIRAMHDRRGDAKK